MLAPLFSHLLTHNVTASSNSVECFSLLPLFQHLFVHVFCCGSVRVYRVFNGDESWRGARKMEYEITGLRHPSAGVCCLTSGALFCSLVACSSAAASGVVPIHGSLHCAVDTYLNQCTDLNIWRSDVPTAVSTRRSGFYFRFGMANPKTVCFHEHSFPTCWAPLLVRWRGCSSQRRPAPSEVVHRTLTENILIFL